MICCLCDKPENVVLFFAGRHRIVKCAACGLVYTADFKTGAEIYDNSYFTLKNQYVARWEEFCAMFESLMDKILRFKRSGRLLDVGAGVGALLSVAVKRGFSAQGVEVSDWASAFARIEKGLDVITGTLEDARFGTGAFDVVVLNHLLEHVHYPRSLLAEVRRILKNDGLLSIGVPNISSIMATLKGGRWVSLHPEEHIWHFSPETLEKLLLLSGFEILRFESKENHAVTGWAPRALARRLINRVSVWTNCSEAMLVFAQKRIGLNE